MVTRRSFIAGAGLLAASSKARALRALASWESLAASYRTPDWFRDAKFGIWAHWSAQCVPEQGDWYGRKMYLQGSPINLHHVKTYGHPTRVGFMEIENLWKAEAWEPETLMRLYKKAGARYFMSLACHHDNLDTFDSAHHAWNTLRVGPKRDIVGTWEKVAREAGMRFGVSNHSSHSWHWYQPAYGYDAEGPLAGKRYDAARLTAADGKGKWWDGLDPQELYNGPFMPAPDGIATMKEMDAWHQAFDGQWLEGTPPGARGRPYAAKWFARQTDLVAKYRPDIVYLDDAGLPFEQIGLDAVADYYRQATSWSGSPDVVITAKQLSVLQRRGLVEDVERGFASEIKVEPWQTCTCIGDWHYDRSIFERHGYKTAKQVLQRLCDVVSKNGNLLLSVPIKGNGTIDADEEAILADLARWFAHNGDAIHNSRPWHTFGEGPNVPPTGMLSEDKMKPYVANDVRITVTRGGLNLFLLDQPAGALAIACLGRDGAKGGVIEQVRLTSGEPVRFRQERDALHLELPPAAKDNLIPGLRLEGRGLVTT